MPSTFVGIETAFRALQAQQKALEVTGHNIANANT
ncbi:MAG TPA: flagellar basal body protein, partial [Bacillota bacterium]|nr:flagellar basal body protein [Bacillota bacterium]